MMGIWTGLTSACQDLASHVPVPARAPTVISSPGHRRSTPSAISAWPSSPVWVLMYWRGTLSTSHVHTRRAGRTKRTLNVQPSRGHGRSARPPHLRLCSRGPSRGASLSSIGSYTEWRHLAARPVGFSQWHRDSVRPPAGRPVAGGIQVLGFSLLTSSGLLKRRILPFPVRLRKPCSQAQSM